MIRFSLSKIFATFAPSTNRTKDLRLGSLKVYRNEILDGTRAVLRSKGIDMTAHPYEYGKASFEVKTPDAAAPCKFHISTEWSDFLLHTGKEAVVRITNESALDLINDPAFDPQNAKFIPQMKAAFNEVAFYLLSPKTFAYGSSRSPDSARHDLGMDCVVSSELAHAIFMDQLEGIKWDGAEPEPPVRCRNDIRKIVDYILQETEKIRNAPARNPADSQPAPSAS